jgi:integrase/recombinase XerD
MFQKSVRGYPLFLFIKKSPNHMRKHLEAGYRPWLAAYSHQLERLGYSPASRKVMQGYVREFLHYLQSNQLGIETLTTQHIAHYLTHLEERPNLTRGGTLSESSLAYHIFSLKALFTYLEQGAFIPVNPMSSLVLKSPVKREREAMSREMIQCLYEAAETLRDRAMLGLFYGLGLRRSEAEKLNIADVSLKSSVLYVREGKGRKRRAVPMSEQVKQDLYNYLCYERGFYVRRPTEDNRQAFMLNRYGNRMRGLSYDRHLKQLLEKAGLPLHWSLHHLRHSIATHLLEGGMPLEQVRDFLGHSMLETTQLYTKISKSYLHRHT